MDAPEIVLAVSLDATMIAPCGMDCGLCIAHLRWKDRCGGCRGDKELHRAKHCAVCRIRNCDRIDAGAGESCSDCVDIPCARLRQLDKRYRTRYGMSMLQNLADIRDEGLECFIASERERWSCPECGGVVCVHREACMYCGHVRVRATGPADPLVQGEEET